MDLRLLTWGTSSREFSYILLHSFPDKTFADQVPRKLLFLGEKESVLHQKRVSTGVGYETALEIDGPKKLAKIFHCLRFWKITNGGHFGL